MKTLALTLTLALLAPVASADVDALRAFALKTVNRERVKQNLPALKLDAEASKIAQQHAERLLRGTPEALTPYMRYSFAGGTDVVRENVHSFTVSYPLTDRALQTLIREAHQAMMQDEPPLHGRRGSILDPHATHAGFGMAWERGQFFIVQEFVRRYVEFTQPLPREATTLDSVLVSGRSRTDALFHSITVHREDPPREATIREALPEKPRDYFPKLGSFLRRENGKVNYYQNVYDENPSRLGEVDLTPDGVFSLSVPFPEGAGVYTIVIWMRHPEMAKPFMAGSVSIRVEEAVAPLS